jgi:hypothetical protein
MRSASMMTVTLVVVEEGTSGMMEASATRLNPWATAASTNPRSDGVSSPSVRYRIGNGPVRPW